MLSASEAVQKHSIIIGDAGFLSEETTQLLDDYDRVNYYKSHMNEVLKGIYDMVEPIFKL